MWPAADCSDPCLPVSNKAFELTCLLHRSRLLGELHVALLRLLQADMEEARAAAGQGPGAPSLADKAFAQSAACLEEAWAWGFDVDVWRAHLNAITWPEVHCILEAPLQRK